MAKTKTVRPASEWVTLRDAILLTSKQLGGDALAKAAIANRLKDGLLRGNCLWWAHGTDVGQPLVAKSLTYDADDKAGLAWAQSEGGLYEMTVPTVTESSFGSGKALFVSPCHKTRGILGSGFWNWGDPQNWETDFKRWDWSCGLVVVTNKPAIISKSPKIAFHHKLPSRYFAHDVRVERSGLMMMVVPETMEAEKRNTNAGAKKTDKWHQWVAELALYIHENGVHWSDSPDTVINTIADRLAERGVEALDRSTTYPTAKAVVDRLKGDGGFL